MNKIALSVVVYLALSFFTTAKAAEFVVNPLMVAHLSDPSDGGRSDATMDFLGSGVEVRLGQVTIEAAVGRKALNCSARTQCPSTLGAYASLKWSLRPRTFGRGK